VDNLAARPVSLANGAVAPAYLYRMWHQYLYNLAFSYLLFSGFQKQYVQLGISCHMSYAAFETVDHSF